jgi:hypothetical protein
MTCPVSSLGTSAENAALDDLSQKLCETPLIDVRTLNGYTAVAYTMLMTRAEQLDKHPLFVDYFGLALKGEGEPVIIPTNVPEELVAFLNIPVGNLFGTLAINVTGTSPDHVYRALAQTEGGSLNPLVDITNRQTLYAKVEREGDTITKVELAKICPHDDPMQMTVVLAGFYLNS